MVELKRKFVEDLQVTDGPQLKHIWCPLQSQHNHPISVWCEKIEVDMVVRNAIGVCDQNKLAFLHYDLSDVVNFPRIWHRHKEKFIVSRKICFSVLVVANN